MKDWTHLFEKYRGKWVVLDEDEVTVLAADKDAKAAYKAAHNHGILYRVPDTLDYFVEYAAL